MKRESVVSKVVCFAILNVVVAWMQRPYSEPGSSCIAVEGFRPVMISVAENWSRAVNVKNVLKGLCAIERTEGEKQRLVERWDMKSPWLSKTNWDWATLMTADNAKARYCWERSAYVELNRSFCAAERSRRALAGKLKSADGPELIECCWISGATYLESGASWPGPANRPAKEAELISIDLSLFSQNFRGWGWTMTKLKRTNDFLSLISGQW